MVTALTLGISGHIIDFENQDRERAFIWGDCEAVMNHSGSTSMLTGHAQNTHQHVSVDVVHPPKGLSGRMSRVCRISMKFLSGLKQIRNISNQNLQWLNGVSCHYEAGPGLEHFHLKQASHRVSEVGNSIFFCFVYIADFSRRNVAETVSMQLLERWMGMLQTKVIHQCQAGLRSAAEIWFSLYL